jgi:hypothetical protein
MTIAIGINLGSYAVLAADTRTTYHRFGMPFYDDNSTKVQKTTMGLITGAGFLPLLDSVKRKLATEQITNTERVLSIIKEESERTLQAWRTHSQIDSWVEQTGWIFSYTTLLNNQPALRVGIFHPSINKETYVTYEVGYPEIILPVELDHETAEAIYDPILQQIKVPGDSSELQSSIDQNIAVIGALINALQPHCPSISRRFQVGIHSGGQVGISDLTDIQDDGTFGLNIKLENL